MVNKPKKLISVNEAKTLQDNWKETRAVELDRMLGFEDCREFYYSIEELQEYIDYVKAKSVEQEIENPGIRIFFAAYKKPQNPDDFATIFLAPTKEVDGKWFNNYDIEPLNNSKGGMPPDNY